MALPQAPAVLLVDDEIDILDMLERAIRRRYAGAHVDKAPDAARAEKLLSSRSYDIVVSDYRMPGKDGVTFLRDSQALAPKSVRILLTAFPELDPAIRAINDAHLEKFLTKPVGMPEFIGAVEECWNQKRAEDARATAFARSFSQLKARLDGVRGRQIGARIAKGSPPHLRAEL